MSRNRTSTGRLSSGSSRLPETRNLLDAHFDRSWKATAVKIEGPKHYPFRTRPLIATFLEKCEQRASSSEVEGNSFTSISGRKFVLTG